MKILQIIPQLSSGGGERFTVDLCNELSKTNDVTLVVLHPLVESTAFYLPQVSPKVKVISMEKKMGVDASLFLRLYNIVRKERPDIIHTHLRAIVYTAFLTSFVVYGVHTIHNEASVEASEWFSRFARKLLFRFRRVQPVTISPQSHESFVRFYGYDAPMICNGRDIPSQLAVSDTVKEEFLSYRTRPTTRCIVQLAHLDDVKRQLLMARVAHRLSQEGYDLAVLFIGSTRDTEYVAKVKEAMPPCCHILGQRDNPLEYLKEAGAFALCSRYEGLPISLIEALGVGAVPICMPLGGIPDLVKDGTNGFLSSDLEEESYYQAMKRYLSAPEATLSAMKQRAQESYAPFSMRECAAKYLALYKSICKKHKKR